jgi:hypothetical protein
LKSAESGHRFILIRIFNFIIYLNLVVSVLFLGLTYYRSEIIYEGQLHVKYVKYYILFFASIIFWTILLGGRKVNKFIAIVCFFAVTAFLYGAEIVIYYVSINRDVTNRLEAAQALGVKFDERTKFNVCADLVDQGFDAFPCFQPTNLIDSDKAIFPLGGASHKTTVGGNENGKYMIYESDRFGFNNPDDAWDSKSLEWFLTGDSMIQGMAVQPGEDIGGRIRTLTNQSVINVGMSGNGPLIELAVINEYAVCRKPNKVLWFYFEGNDLAGDLWKEKTESFLMKYLNNPTFTQNLKSRQNEIDIMLKRYVQEQMSCESKRFLTNLLLLPNVREILIHNHNYITIDPLFKKILGKARDQVESWGGNLYFIYLTQFERYELEVKNHDNFRKRCEVIAQVNELGIPVVDLHTELFSTLPDPKALFPLRLNGHYSAQGYHKVAQILVDRIVR